MGIATHVLDARIEWKTAIYQVQFAAPGHEKAVAKRRAAKARTNHFTMLDRFVRPKFACLEGLTDAALGYDVFEHVYALIDCLGAVRQVCFDPEQEQGISDMKELVNNISDESQIRNCLRVSGADDTAVEKWFEYALQEAEYVVCDGGDMHHRDDTGVYYCEYKEVWMDDDKDIQVRVSRNSMETWSLSETENHCFYCDVTDQYYSDSDYQQGETGDGGTLCIEFASNNDYSYHEGRDRWYHCDDDIWSDDDDDDDEDRDGDEDPHIPSYANACRNWDLSVATRSLRAYYGLEIEVDFGDFSNRRECWDQLFRGSDNHHFAAEHDGSLNDESGLEIITRPFSMQELNDPNNGLKSLLAVVEECGGTDGGDGYGVHITSNINRLNGDHQKRVRTAAIGMRRMTEIIARREGDTEYRNYGYGEHQKHSAAYMRPNGSMEFRVFRSTVDWNVLMSYVEYLEAITAWTQDPNRTINGPLAQAMFRAWVAVHGASYPHLRARLPATNASPEELQKCVLQSSSRPVNRSPKQRSASASPIIPMEPALLSPQAFAIPGGSNIVSGRWMPATALTTTGSPHIYTIAEPRGPVTYSGMVGTTIIFDDLAS